MNLKKLASVASIVLAFASSHASAENAGRWEQWLNSYYQHPQPEKVVQAAYGLDREGYFQQPGATATAIGFFSTVFAAHPEKVDGWFANFRNLPVSEQRIMASALWYSGNAKGEQKLVTLARSASPETRQEIEQLVAKPAMDVVSTPVQSDSSMNLQWGAFLASGEEQNVTNILAAIGRGQIGDSARVSLAFNASQHDRVMQICRAQLDKQPNEVRSVLRAVINDAETKKQQPTS
jgi:hypothetical protein